MSNPQHRADRFLTHNENACKGQHCAECTPSTKTPQHRADETKEAES